MSRDLPARPNLDHLRKQAKTVLRSMREHRADATLSEAQHAVAREHGFASWPKLKAHLEAVPEGDGAGGGRDVGGAAAGADAPRPLFPRFTEAARRALFFSRYEAASAGRLRIEPEHTLLGLIRAASGATRGLLEDAGLTLDGARTAVTDPEEARRPIVEGVEIPFQPATQALFRAAADEADRLGHDHIATIHIVLALAGGDDAAGSFLRARGITPENVRATAAAGGGRD